MPSSRVNITTGRIEIRAYAGKDPVTGKVRNLSESLPQNADQSEIDAEMAKLDARAKFCRGQKLPFTVNGLLSYYLDSLAAFGHSPTTIASYRSNKRCYVDPFIGSLQADRVQPYMFTSLYKRLITDGGKDARPLSQNTVRKLHAWLHAAFRWLCEASMLDHNPLDGIRPPRIVHHEAMALCEADFSALRSYLLTESESLDEAIWLCLHTGVRRGELAGFRVKDFNRAAGTIRVSRSLVQAREGLSTMIYKDPKSSTGKRTISLDSHTCIRLARYINNQRSDLAASGTKQTGETPLFAHDDGSPHRPSQYADRFRAIVKKIGIDQSAHLHTLRHTHATYLLESGVNIKTVSERLGHSSVVITLHIYGHVLPGRDAAAADAFGALSRGMDADT